MSYPGYPPGPPGRGGYPPSGGGYPPSGGGYPPSGGGYPPSGQPGYPPGPAMGMPGGEQSTSWSGSYGQTPPMGGPAPYPTSGSTPYPTGGSAPYPTGSPAPYPTGGSTPYPTSGSTPYPTGGSAPYPTGGGGVAPSYPPPPQQGGSSFGYGSDPTRTGGGYPPAPTTSSYTPYPSQQTPGGYQIAPPPVPSSSTHHHSSHPSHTHQQDDVTQATGGTASLSGSTYKEPPTEGTVQPSSSFDPETDAGALRTAMKGFGTDEKAIINVLAYRSNQQRQEIKKKFKSVFGKDLILELKSELSGHFESVVLGLLMTPREYDAYILRNAIKGVGTDEAALIEVLCTKTNPEIIDIKQQYKKDYGRDLESDVKSDTSGHFKRLLTSVLTGAREPNGTVDRAKARAEAQELYKAGEARWGTDESKFNQILASRSFVHLQTVFEEYSKICKYDIEQSISREMSGDLKESMLTIVKCARDKPGYFTEKLYKSMKGLGTDDSALIHVMVSRCEIDMVQIKRIFYTRYHKTLASFIKGDTSGDYKRILLALADED